jgi:hypothetical protein
MQKVFRTMRRSLAFAGTAVVVVVLTAISASAQSILPHRAGYELRLESVRSGSGIIDAVGVLSYDWADSCDGWSVGQRYMLEITRGEGPPFRITAAYTNWEAKDGLHYRYYVKRSRTSGPEETPEEVRGEARLKAKNQAGQAEFEQPRNETVPLPEGTVFPTAHTIILLQKAAAGEKFDRRFVFDGSELEGPSAISAFILRQRKSPPAGQPKALTAPQPVWPISLAIFPGDSKAETPEFEMTIYLQPNGVVPEMTMNYGDFTVRGILKVFEALKKPEC